MPEWTSATGEILYNVFYNTPFNKDTTSQYNFLLWCESRDDSKVIDAIPDFQWISVIDPKFEREVIILDFTQQGVTITTSPNAALITPTNYVKSVLGNLINRYGSSNLGKDNVFDFNLLPCVYYVKSNGSLDSINFPAYGTTQDYYAIQTIRTSYSALVNYHMVSLREFLKHKIIFIIKDNINYALNMQGSADNPYGMLELISVVDGLNAGMSCWSMSRDAFGGTPDSPVPEFSSALSDAYRSYFGVLRIFMEGWAGAVQNRDEELWTRTRRNENFIGADVINDFKGAFPPLKIDTTLLEQRYYWYINTPPTLVKYPFRWDACMPELSGQMIVGALPEVGFVEKAPSSLVKAIYLYKSCYRPPGDSSAADAGLPEVGTYTEYDLTSCPTGAVKTLYVGSNIAYKGRVVAIYTDAYYFRTSHFSFTLLPFDSASAQQVFYSMMDSLYASPFIGQTGKLTPPSAASMKPHRGVNVEEFRRITKELHDMKNEEIRKAREEAAGYSDGYSQ